jgi:hypothetical protein
MTDERAYTCTVCKRDVERDQLMVKRVQFKIMGKGGPLVATRTTGWLCVIPAEDGGPSCLEKDSDFNRPSWIEAPGHVRQAASG